MVSFHADSQKFTPKLKKQWPYIVLVFLVPVLAILWWWGLFTTAGVEVVERGPYHYAYLTAQGPYSKLEAKRGEAAFTLQQQGIVPQTSLTLILDDPRTTPTGERNARVGFLIKDGVTVQPPLQTDTLPVRQVVEARVKAHPIFAYGKVYGALLDYVKQHDMGLRMPTLEFYDASILTVEMPLENTP